MLSKKIYSTIIDMTTQKWVQEFKRTYFLVSMYRIAASIQVKAKLEETQILFLGTMWFKKYK